MSTVERLTETVNYIRVATRDPDDSLEDWVPGDLLVNDADHLYETTRVAMEGRGIDRDDIGMSLIVQGYAFRIASVAIGCWYLGGGVIDLSPTNVRIQFGRNRPNAVMLEHERWVAAETNVRLQTLDDLHRHLVAEHMAPLVETARRATRVGSKMLWSNVASSCASSFGALMGPLAAERESIREAAEAFFASADPLLRAGGDVVPVGPVWAWQRSACCLYYQQSGGSKCEDCSLFSDAERSARYERIREEIDR